MALQLQIVTPGATAFSGTVAQVRAPGLLGEFGVLPDHMPFLSVLKAGVVRLSTSDGERAFVVGRGFAEVGATRVVLLTEQAEDGASVDKSAAQKELEEAEKVLAGADPRSGEWANAERRAELARARLSV